ncbi:outer membrane lipoprotein OmlA [Bordetella petrii]|uniref:Outer membrane protein assembly factor BamE n=1 Tax=Bordetella petrii (strain ATCC BAA-461 / DSM 12804 / CCUG 43448 / CIP 107267 / Se-1111R) TaxID=340100 RepID=A9IGB0_BORPD|nr:outer membrane lipoprotein OmlA [Bordetella petrii]
MIARIPTRFLKTVLAAATVTAALAGCTSDKWGFPYKAPVQQGNWITQEQVALLQPGMTREQVRFALGSPTLTSVLHADRWDYPYYFKPGYGKAQERKFTVWFDNDRLVRWSGDEQPELQPFQLDAEGKPALEKADEQIDADTARQDAAGINGPTAPEPADPAQLPALGTPPGGAQPAEPATSAEPVPAPDMGGAQPDASQAQNPAAQPAATSPARRELRLNSPDALPRSSIGQPGGGAEPLR